MSNLNEAIKEAKKSCAEMEKSQTTDSQLIAISKTMVVLAEAIAKLDDRLSRIEAFNARY